MEVWMIMNKNVRTKKMIINEYILIYDITFIELVGKVRVETS